MSGQGGSRDPPPAQSSDLVNGGSRIRSDGTGVFYILPLHVSCDFRDFRTPLARLADRHPADAAAQKLLVADLGERGGISNADA